MFFFSFAWAYVRLKAAHYVYIFQEINPISQFQGHQQQKHQHFKLLTFFFIIYFFSLCFFHQHFNAQWCLIWLHLNNFSSIIWFPEPSKSRVLITNKKLIATLFALFSNHWVFVDFFFFGFSALFRFHLIFIGIVLICTSLFSHSSCTITTNK